MDRQFSVQPYSREVETSRILILSFRTPLAKLVSNITRRRWLCPKKDRRKLSDLFALCPQIKSFLQRFLARPSCFRGLLLSLVLSSWAASNSSSSLDSDCSRHLKRASTSIKLTLIQKTWVADFNFNIGFIDL